MKTDDFFYLGKIVKTHGLQGELSCYIDADIPQNYNSLTSVFIMLNEGLVPFGIKNLNIRDNGFAIVKFHNFESQQVAKAYVGKSLYLPVDFLPELDNDKFYYHEIIDYAVVDKKHGNIGFIKGVIEHPLQALLQIYDNNTEILIPVNDKFITKLDKKNQIMYVETPDGLIDMYKNE